MRRTWAPACLLLSAHFALLSCASTTGQPPRDRLGSIPFPGVFTLYATADPNNLGQHRYEAWWDKLGQPAETSRGIMYTCRAGFIDLSHIRDSIDWTRFLCNRSRQALQSFGSGGSTPGFSFTLSDARYEIELHEPDWWSRLSPAQREHLVAEASIVLGQRLAVIAATWHEIGTWFGQQTIPGVSEQNSAFTWDDATSHIIAAIVAGRALRSDEPFDLAVTRELSIALEDLEVVDADCQARAVQMVYERWWKGGVAIRRDFETGLVTPKHPWTVPDLDCCPRSSPLPLTVPSLQNVDGYDLSSLLSFQIYPARSILRSALRCDPDCPPCIRGEPDLLTAIETVRSQVLDRFGPDADRP
ncbi:MAG: DUF4056 domain-containing protein [Phycisphaerales bacterium]|nr:DUF4056 domain-containing protein [Planctomycetota bacterium]